MMCYYGVLLPAPFDEIFTYRSQLQLDVGDIVKVEFGKRKLFGLVMSEIEELEVAKLQEKGGFKIKDILEKNDLVSFSAEIVNFIDDLASYNCAAKGMVLKSFIGFLNSDKVSKKTIEKSNFEQNFDYNNLKIKELSSEQKRVAEGILAKIRDENVGYFTSLIDGVTGSGKTEIYFKIIAEILRKNPDRQILIILPEIALSSQLLSRFEKVFGFDAILWHSKISTAQKRDSYYAIANGKAKVVIGARSALLLPYKNLQMIIVDEEHDGSLKQDDVFNFHARDMAILRASKSDFPVILSSATPSLESFVNAKSGKYDLYQLKKKFSNKENKVEFIDLRQHKLDRGTVISDQLKSSIAKNFEKKKQSLLFLNRRGYSPVTICQKCGEKNSCLSCSANLVYHKKRNKLVCHYCDYQAEFSKDCTKCGAKNSVIDIGIGSEKLYEEVQRTFPDLKIALITSDNVGNFNEMKKFVADMESGNIDLVIGTQMICKGYDFKNLTLIGVVDVDSMLYSSDFRANEKSFAMLSQLTGRVGRGDQDGLVLIQTYNPENFILQQLKKGDRDDFYDYEIGNRKIANLPPFFKMVRLEISSFFESDCEELGKNIKKFIKNNKNIEISGPSPAMVPRIKNRYYYNIFLTVNKKINLQKIILHIKTKLCVKKNIKFRVDIDPN